MQKLNPSSFKAGTDFGHCCICDGHHRTATLNPSKDGRFQPKSAENPRRSVSSIFGRRLCG
jgi:hypothetical protein